MDEKKNIFIFYRSIKAATVIMVQSSYILTYINLSTYVYYTLNNLTLSNDK